MATFGKFTGNSGLLKHETIETDLDVFTVELRPLDSNQR